MHRARHLADDLHVLLPQRDLHRRRLVAALDHEGHAQAHRAGADVGARTHVLQRHRRVQPHAAAQRHHLGIGHVVDRHQVVGGQLQLHARAQRPDARRVQREGARQRRGLAAGGLRAAQVHDPGLLRRGRGRAADGRVDHAPALAPQRGGGGQLVGQRQRARLDHELPRRRRPGLLPLGHHGVQRGRARQRGDEHLGRARDLGVGRQRPPAGAAQPGAAGSHGVVADDLVARLDQGARHDAAHRAQADEADAAWCVLHGVWPAGVEAAACAQIAPGVVSHTPPLAAAASMWRSARRRWRRR